MRNSFVFYFISVADGDFIRDKIKKETKLSFELNACTTTMCERTFTAEHNKTYTNADFMMATNHFYFSLEYASKEHDDDNSDNNKSNTKKEH